MASWMSRIGPRSPAACRKAAGTSLVADIARNCITSPRGSRKTVDEAVDEAVARSSESRAELSFDEGVVARQVETVFEDGGRDSVGIDDLRADHLRPVVEVQTGISLVLGEVGDEQDDRPVKQRELDDR